MTITLTRPVRIGGVELAAATTQTLSADIEADLVARGSATPAGLPPGVAGAGANFLAQLAEIGMPLKFPGFRPCLLASLTAGATATKAAGSVRVTITSTAHGVSNAFNLFRFYWPGSANSAAQGVPAGWYDGLVVIDANSLRFDAPQSAIDGVFTSDSINGGAAYTTATEACSLDLPANTLTTGSAIEVRAIRTGDTTAGNKTVQLKFGGSSLIQSTRGSSPAVVESYSIFCAGDSGAAQYNAYVDGSASSVFNFLTKDPLVAQPLAIALQVASAQMYAVLAAAFVRIMK